MGGQYHRQHAAAREERRLRRGVFRFNCHEHRGQRGPRLIGSVELVWHTGAQPGRWRTRSARCDFATGANTLTLTAKLVNRGNPKIASRRKY